MKKNLIISISNSFAGVAKYQAQNFDYLSNKGVDIMFFDHVPKNTLEFMKIKKKLNIYYLEKLLALKKNKLILKENIEKVHKKYSNKIIFLNNGVYLIFYFKFLLDLKKKGYKILFVNHGSILDYSLKNILLFFFVGILSILVPNRIVYVSNSTKKWWLRFNFFLKFKKDQKIILHGHEKTKKVNKKLSKEKINISFIGRLDNEKNPDLFVKTAIQACYLNKDYIFNIYGNGKEYENLIKKSFGVINFRGWEKSSEIYKNTDILVITSRVESLSYTLLEAKFHGIPSIVCSEGGVREIFQSLNDGYLIDKKKVNSIDILKGIDYCIKNYSKLSKNCFKNRKKYLSHNSMRQTWGDLLI